MKLEMGDTSKEMGTEAMGVDEVVKSKTVK